MIAWDQNSVKIDAGVMDRTPMRFYPVFYDIDTAFGTNVQGGLYATPYVAWPYAIGTRYTPVAGAGQEYNCFGTNFLKRISKCYETALCRRYQELRSGTVDPIDGKTKISAPFDYSNILQLYNKQMVGRIGERYFNEDAVFKYVGFTNDPDRTAKRNYITNARGNKVMFMKNFLKKRMDYIDGVLGYVPDVEDMAYIQHYSQGTLTLGIETATAAYIRVSFAQNQVISVFCNGVTPTYVSYNYPGITQHILRIYNCAIVTNITGLASKDVRIARLNSCTALRTLDLSGNPNFGLENSTIAISECKSLLSLNLTACNGANPLPLNLSGCVQLKEFLVSNSSVSDVAFTTNLNLETIDIRKCPNFTTLSVAGLYNLNQLDFDEDKLISLEISDSSISPDFSQPNTYNNLETLLMVGNTTVTSIKFDPTSFLNLGKLFISDCPLLETVEDLFKDRTNPVELNTNFLGNCNKLLTVRNIFENSIVTAIPSGLFSGGSALNIKTMTGCFKNCKNLNSFSADVLSRSYPNLEDITELFYGAILQLYEDVWGLDQWGNAAVISKTAINIFKSDNVLNNCPKLKTISKAFYAAELINIPTNIFLGSTILSNLDYCFSEITNPISTFDEVSRDIIVPSTLFNTALQLQFALSAIGVFQNSNLSIIHNDIFTNAANLVNANYLFNGCQLTSIPTGIFTSAPKLKYAQLYILKICTISIWWLFYNKYSCYNIYYCPNVRRY